MHSTESQLACAGSDHLPESAPWGEWNHLCTPQVRLLCVFGTLSGAVLFAVSCPPCKYLVQQRYKIRLHHCTLHCCKHTSLQQALPCRSTCDFVAGRLQDADIDAAAYHAGLSGAARSRVQQDWSEVGGQHASRPLLQLGSYSVSVCLVPNSAMPMRGVKQ